MTADMYRKAIDALDREVMVLDVSGTVLSANQEARRLIDAPMGDERELGQFTTFWNEPADDIRKALRRLAGTSTWQPITLTRASGQHAGLRMHLRGRALLSRTAEGATELNVLVTADAQRERSFDDHRRLIRSLNMKLAQGSRQESLLASMLESEKHLRHELIHRVKNNLSLLTSLLRINSSRSREPEVREQLEEMERRILSIAAVHDLLDRTQETDFVRADELIEKICHELETSLVPGRVVIRRDLVPVRLHISDATPLALIVNELVTNALKHAFPENKAGRISIHLKKNGIEKLEAVVHDDGVGMSMATGEEHIGTGTRILEALATQLHGEIVREERDGTTWQLVFEPQHDLEPLSDALH